MALILGASKYHFFIWSNVCNSWFSRGIEAFRQMDSDGDMKVSAKEFVTACAQDPELCALLERSLGQEVLTNKKE